LYRREHYHERRCCTAGGIRIREREVSERSERTGATVVRIPPGPLYRREHYHERRCCTAGEIRIREREVSERSERTGATVVRIPPGPYTEPPSDGEATLDVVRKENLVRVRVRDGPKRRSQHGSRGRTE
ncbi:DUF1540 domain-containing protein, partial [Natronomonas sp.]|uniref:DUF1540 domain-containing protein n=1 Tax=Natronomonas sp. TaxID=2184060 RepID=UPI002602BED8